MSTSKVNYKVKQVKNVLLTPVSSPIPSIRLTAFVLKSFVQANTYIDIDTGDIIKTRRWLLSMQDKQSGCFRNSGVLRHKSMKVRYGLAIPVIQISMWRMGMMFLTIKRELQSF